MPQAVAYCLRRTQPRKVFAEVGYLEIGVRPNELSRIRLPRMLLDTPANPRWHNYQNLACCCQKFFCAHRLAQAFALREHTLSLRALAPCRMSNGSRLRMGDSRAKETYRRWQNA